MIVAAALCPAPPLLIPGLTGSAEVAADLRQACREAVDKLAASDPDVLAVVGAADETRTWPAHATLDLARFAPGLDGSARTGELPASIGVGASLLEQIGYGGQRLLQSVAYDTPAEHCASIGASLARGSARTALLVLGDGSACRDEKAPGYFDDRSAGFDAVVEHAMRSGDLGALLSIDMDLARELMATGRPSWQVLAGALDGSRLVTEIRYSDDPYGVAYLVVTLAVEWPQA